jgi:large subunit ribosomal protein L21
VLLHVKPVATVQVLTSSIGCSTVDWFTGEGRIEMFAVFEDGSRQYKVRQGDILAVDLRSDVQDGQMMTFDKVLLANGGGDSVVGRPLIEGATVTGEVVMAVMKGIKLEIQKHYRRNASRRHTGHRQKYTRVKIVGISIPNLEVSDISSTDGVSTL